MNIAAVDIGSNATRLTIARPPSNRNHFKPEDLIEKLRFPCRLGSDVFNSKKISLKKSNEMHSIFKDIRSAIESHHVSKARVAATSAFRDADNGAALLLELADTFKLDCSILSGQEEAMYMSEGLQRRELFDEEHSHLHMDIGGGSLELSAYDDGAFLFQESLDVGALRLVKDTKTGTLQDNSSIQLNLIKDCLNSKHELIQNFKKPLKVFGTGGNLKRLGKLKVENLKRDDESHFSSTDVQEMLDIFKQHPGQELCNITSIKADNAALIVPSIMIIQKVLEFWPAERIDVPDLSLSHTLLDSLI